MGPNCAFQAYSVRTVGEGIEKNFYDWFYTINFPDIVFADKIILYEGDTERMLIKNILQLPEFEALRNQYVSFVQVGGTLSWGIRAVLTTSWE